MKDIPLPHRAVRDGNGFGLPLFLMLIVVAASFIAATTFIIIALF